MDFQDHEVIFFEKEYKYVSSLGKGGFGKVVLCENIVDKQHYAIKVIPCSEDDTEESLVECQVMAKLDHPLIVKYNHAWIEDGVLQIGSKSSPLSSSSSSSYCPTRTLYIAMQKYDCSVRDEIENKSFDKGRIMKVFKGLVGGLSYLHSMKIVHCDIKPENIFLDKQFVPKIGDFGLSFIDDGDNVEERGGTAGYRPLGEKATAASDVYALAVCMLEIICSIITVGERTRKVEDVKKGNYPAELLETDELIRDTVIQVLTAPTAQDRYTAATIVNLTKDLQG